LQGLQEIPMLFIVKFSGTPRASFPCVNAGRLVESASYNEKKKFFPIHSEKILPVAWIPGLMILAPGFIALGLLSGCHSSTDSVEASTTRDPVVAPAGTVLRVRLSQALDSGRSRPGDRFGGVLETALVASGIEILPKGTPVEGHLVEAQESARAVLAMTLDSYQLEGKRVAIETHTVTRASGAHMKRNWTLVEGNASAVTEATAAKGNKHLTVPAETIVGFTLKSTLSV
jgi:hypothetical protein